MHQVPVHQVPVHQVPVDQVPVVHQPGVVSPPLARSSFAAFDVTAGDRAGLAAALRAVSRPVPGATVTIGLGASLFDGRFGLRPPRLLTPMPAFAADVPNPDWCHGDLLVQVAGATTAKAPTSVPGLRPRWRIDGFHPNGTRNLFGFKEGAGNPEAADKPLMDSLVWVQPDSGEPAWAAGGTYQVVRLIRMAMPSWDSEPLERQEQVFGRRKDTGAPLGLGREADVPDFAGDPDGRTIALNAHIRRANPRTPEAAAHRILRRGWSYRNGPAGADDVGQIFVCYQKDVEMGFATVQRRLAGEALEKYLLPFGGGYYFVPPAGASYPGEAMLGV
ncbi:Dyp-type peroxidase [Actinoplanes sp. NPDC051346]|uniref:Dyp-type peroxidase n=1 Tax=Actinoplanes sp. NPDC051346 TaxID=3155048 RepID=UPI0034327A83